MNNKKLSCIFVIIVCLVSCNTARRTITFQKEVGFQQSEGFYLDCDYVEITRGIAIGEEEIYIKTHQAYVTSNCVCWEGKTMDKNGEELPYVSFYEIDSTKQGNVFNTEKTAIRFLPTTSALLMDTETLMSEANRNHVKAFISIVQDFLAL